MTGNRISSAFGQGLDKDLDQFNGEPWSQVWPTRCVCSCSGRIWFDSGGVPGAQAVCRV